MGCDATQHKDLRRRRIGEDFNVEKDKRRMTLEIIFDKGRGLSVLETEAWLRQAIARLGPVHDVKVIASMTHQS